MTPEEFEIALNNAFTMDWTRHDDAYTTRQNAETVKQVLQRLTDENERLRAENEALNKRIDTLYEFIDIDERLQSEGLPPNDILELISDLKANNNRDQFVGVNSDE